MLVDCNKNNADNNNLSFRHKSNGFSATIPPPFAFTPSNTLQYQIFNDVKY